jgi:hypothetical protein
VEGTWQDIETGNGGCGCNYINHDDSGKLVRPWTVWTRRFRESPRRVTEHAGELKIELSAFGAEYRELEHNENQIAGQWSRTEMTKTGFRRRRRFWNCGVRKSHKPYPYKEKKFRLQSATVKTTLAGTLALPPGTGPFPAAMFIGGSGQSIAMKLSQDTNRLKFRGFSDEKGNCNLRYDKRGIALSQAITRGDDKDFTQMQTRLWRT